MLHQDSQNRITNLDEFTEPCKTKESAFEIRIQLSAFF